jgi:tetratricopeptide (TPR) repeat protein
LFFERARYYYENENYDAAIADLTQAIDLDSSIFQYYHLLSDAYMDYFKSRDALRTMEIAADLFPRNIPTLLKLSETQHILKLNEESLMTIARLLTVDDQNAEAYFMMGLNFRSAGETDRAINAFQTATELNPELIDAWIILGNLYESKNDPEAIKYYEAAINVNPDNPNAWHAKAFYLQNNAQIPAAIELYKKINTIDKYYTDAYLNAGILYMSMDSFAQAKEQFNIIAQLQTQNYIAYYYRGLSNKALGKIEDARNDFQNCINLNPEFAKAKIALAELKSN